MGGRRTNICLIPPDLTWFVGDYRRMAEGVPRPRRPTGRGGEGSKSLVEEKEEEEKVEEEEVWGHFSPPGPPESVEGQWDLAALAARRRQLLSSASGSRSLLPLPASLPSTRNGKWEEGITELVTT